MKKMTLLAASIALVLSGCGSSSDDNKDNTDQKPDTTPMIPLEPSTPADPPKDNEDEEKEEPTSFTIKAIDGYLAFADVYAVDTATCKLIDNSGSLIVNPELTKATLVGTTDANGALELDLAMQDKTLCVVAVAGQTIDKTRGVVESSFVLTAPAGSTEITPFTNYLVTKLAANNLLTVDAAKEEIVDALVDIAATEADVFGDFIATNAQAVEKIAQVLVDVQIAGDGISTDFINDLAETLEDALRDEDVDFDKVVFVYDTVNDTASTVERLDVVATQTEKDQLAKLSVVYGETLSTEALNDLFDGDAGVDELRLVPLLKQNPAVATTISAAFNDDATADEFEFDGTTLIKDKVGTYSFHLFAEDASDVKSEPLLVKVAVTSDAAAPVVGDVAAVNTALEGLALAEGSTIATNTSVDISGLFTDTDSGVLEYKFVSADGSEATSSTVIPGVTLIFDGDNVTLSGVPLVGGEFTFVVSATDGVYVPVTAELTVSVEATSDVSALAGLLEGSHPSNDKVYTYALVLDDTPAFTALAEGSESAYVDDVYYSDLTDLTATKAYSIDGNTITYNGDQTIDYVAYASAKQAVVLSGYNGTDASNFDLVTTSKVHDTDPVIATWTEAAISNGDTWYLVNIDGTVDKYQFVKDNATKNVAITEDVFALAALPGAPVTWDMNDADTLTLDRADTAVSYNLLINDGKLMSVVDGSDVLGLFTTDAELAKRLAAIADFEANL